MQERTGAVTMRGNPLTLVGAVDPMPVRRIGPEADTERGEPDRAPATAETPAASAAGARASSRSS